MKNANKCTYTYDTMKAVLGGNFIAANAQILKKNPENDEDQGRSDENTKNITENQYNITWFFEVRQDTEKLLAIPTKNEKESSSQKLEITALLS